MNVAVLDMLNAYQLMLYASSLDELGTLDSKIKRQYRMFVYNYSTIRDLMLLIPKFTMFWGGNTHIILREFI